MSLRVYLWLIGATSFLAFVSLAAILYFFNPQNAGWPILTLFFLSLFMALCGFFTLVGFGIRKRKDNIIFLPEILNIALRQGVLLSLLIISFLILKLTKIFYWWSALTILIFMVMIEMFFIGKNN